MRDSGFLEKLLDGAVVEWVPLGQLVDTITAPSKVQRSEYRDVGKIPIVDQGITYISGFADDGIKPVQCDDYIIFGDHTEHIKYVDFAFIQGADGLKILRPKFDVPKYVYHALLNYYQKERNYKRHWSKAKETLLPIPCPEDPKKSLAIQAEIVRILDAFTELTTELTTELDLRKKQYNHYRTQLLDFEGTFSRGGGFLQQLLNGATVEWHAISDIFHLRNGYTPSKSNKEYWTNGTVPWFRMDDIRTNGQILDHSLQQISPSAVKGGKLFPANSLIFATTATIGEYAQISVPYLANQQFTNLSLKDKYATRFVNKFLFYYGFILADWCKRNTRTSSIPTVDMDGFRKKLLPIPCPENLKKSLATQAEIVRILDKFDTLTTSLSEGLPREIKLREQQYEYYRGLLLRFPKPEEVA